MTVPGDAECAPSLHDQAGCYSLHAGLQAFGIGTVSVDIEAALLDLAPDAGPLRFESLDCAQQVMASGGRAGVDGGVFNGYAEAEGAKPGAVHVYVVRTGTR